MILDSPLVTYGAPGVDEESGPDRDFATRFCHDLEAAFDGQIIVMENTDPVDAMADQVVDIVFTKERESGRYGFFEGPLKVDTLEPQRYRRTV